MRLTKHDISKLKKIILLAEKIMESAATGSAKKRTSSRGKRIRRTGRELIAFRMMLKKERKKGASASELATRHGVSKAYIYTL